MSRGTLFFQVHERDVEAKTCRILELWVTTTIIVTKPRQIEGTIASRTQGSAATAHTT